VPTVCLVGNVLCGLFAPQNVFGVAAAFGYSSANQILKVPTNVLSIARQGHIENTPQNVLGLVFRPKGD
jgi:hypothetical protein